MPSSYVLVSLFSKELGASGFESRPNIKINSKGTSLSFNDLRGFIEAARALGDVKEIHGAHWDLEIGALTEIFAFRGNFPLLLFDQIPGHPASYRAASNLLNHPRRSALAVGMPTDLSRTEMVQRWKELL